MMQSNLVSLLKSKALLVGSRASRLAIKQVEEVFEGLKFHYPDLRFDVRCTVTKGDIDLQTSLRHLESTNFFTEKLDQWLLDKKVRVAIHSAKDLPTPLAPGLKIVAITKCIENRDVLVFRPHFKMPPFSKTFKVGVSSLRREEELRALYPHARLIDLRGTIEKRLQRLKEGDLDALVMAKAALVRLGYENYDMQVIETHPPSLQGSLAVLAREDDQEMATLFSAIDIRREQKTLYFGLDPSRFLSAGPLTHCPLIEIKPLPLSKENREKIALCSYLLITSQTTLNVLFDLFQKQPDQLKLLKQKRVIAVGLATQQGALKKGLRVDYLSIKESQEGLVDLFSQIPQALLPKIVYPKSAQARGLLPHFLKQLYPKFSCFDLYQTRGIQPHPLPKLEEFQQLVFTSASTVHSFFENYSQCPSHLTFVFKGEPSKRVFLEKHSRVCS